MRGHEIFLFMASINLCSPVFDLLLAPALPLFSECSHSRHCPELSDARWLTLGVARCIEAHPSSRSFLQTLASNAPDLCPDHSHWFASLKSERRLRLCRQLNEHLRSLLCRTLPDALRVFPCLNDYAIYAGDGHSHDHACHDPLDAKGNRLTVGHLYTRNLRSGALSHLCVADQAQRDKEHDMRGLKRQNIQRLRHGTPQGGKTLIIWDCPSLRSRPAFMASLIATALSRHAVRRHRLRAMV